MQGEKRSARNTSIICVKGKGLLWATSVSQPEQWPTKSLVDLLASTDKAVVDVFTVAAQERKLDERIGSVILQTIAQAQPDTAVLDIQAPGRIPQGETRLTVRLWE